MEFASYPQHSFCRTNACRLPLAACRFYCICVRPQPRQVLCDLAPSVIHPSWIKALIHLAMLWTGPVVILVSEHVVIAPELGRSSSQLDCAIV
ncbi:hypothetical protein AWZ03_010290 [Drosophila navojoa]|uniref:Uncharacterized protein n=1 Tax=Drosophila navojoa TaxID=7232 RepID=A0A484B638_DRONA|nr:hypothetical protein AWZ03_010290 [Drosophila navojoa]